MVCGPPRSTCFRAPIAIYKANASPIHHAQGSLSGIHTMQPHAVTVLCASRATHVGSAPSLPFIVLACFRSFVITCTSIMAIFLGMVSQKGGVGKSTLARLVAREYAAGWNVKIADL